MRARTHWLPVVTALAACAPIACDQRKTAATREDGAAGQGVRVDVPEAQPTVVAHPRPAWGGNVLILMLDTLRADRLGAGGYRRAGKSLTPHLDAFAATSVRFTRAYAQGANTPRSLPSLLTSRYPSHIGFRKSFHNFPVVRDDNVLLFEVLAAAGLATAHVSSHFYFVPQRGLAQGIADYDNSGTKDLVGSNADFAAPRIVPRVIARLEARATQPGPFGMFVHLFEAHSTYLDHPEHPVTERGEPGLIARYDYEIAIEDHWVGEILTALDRTGLAAKTMVVIVSDHGEAFGEHSFAGQRAFFHGQTLYDEVLRVPLLIRVPGVAPAVRDEVIAVLDVAPTIVDALELPPVPSFEGRSLMQAVRGGPALAPRPILAEIQSTPDFVEPSFAVVSRDGTRKLLVNGPDKRTELFDLIADADERRDRAEKEPRVVARLRAELDATLGPLLPGR